MTTSEGETDVNATLGGNAMSYFFTEDGLEPGNPQSVTYNGSDQYVWSIFNGDPDPETGEPTAGFIDTATRVSK